MNLKHHQKIVQWLWCIPFFLLGSVMFSQVSDSLRYPLRDTRSPLYLDPKQIEVFYDAESGKYLVYRKIGNLIVGEPMVMTPEEYSAFILRQKINEYYKQKVDKSTGEISGQQGQESTNLIPTVKVKSKLFEEIFGGNTIEFIPQGSASIDLGILYQRLDNPMIIPRNRTNLTIDLQQRIQMSLQGKIGRNLNLRANYDTQAGFGFENRLNLRWQGDEDKIIRNIEFGNVSMPLSTSLMTGVQSLFGVKTDLQFGRTAVTAVFSEQQSEARNITVQNGGTVNTFKINVTDYEDNQHYFLGQYFRGKYDDALLEYPLINSKISIGRIEVWKIDIGNTALQNQRAILALRDIGDGVLPTTPMDNSNNGNLFQSIATLPGIRNPSTAHATISGQIFNDPNTNTPVTYVDGEHFVFNRKARRLNPNEYFFNPQLGFISLNQRLPDDQLLAVAFQYTLNDNPTQVYKVGEFSEEQNQVLIVKLLKPNNTVNTASPLWDLMMKNVYALPGSQISRDGFMLGVYYRDPVLGKINYLPDPLTQDIPLVRLVNWDRLNLNGDVTNNANGSVGDGLFDFVQNITIFPERGKVIHTKVEPYGNYLTSLGVNPQLIFNDLYRKQRMEAIENVLSTRYTLEGRFKGTMGDGISLGALNVPRGSVRVTANGQQLTEGVDYTVDYQLGRVKIINQALADSGVPINVSLENRSAFNVQRKRFWGLNMEHKFSEKLSIGGTILNYKERALTQKAQFGAEPVNNTMLGANLLYNSDAPWLTRLTDALPFIKTDAPSNIAFRAEAAYLLPNQNRAVQNQTYIDDFDDTAIKISLRDPNTWHLASKPKDFPGGLLSNNIAYGYNRALASWYTIDPRFYGAAGSRPPGINNNSVSNHASRRVQAQEVFNNRDFVAGEQLFLNTLDFTIYPNERGPYNLNTAPEPPESRWAGIMRALNITNFVQSNIEYVEFWMMDPKADHPSGIGTNPELIVHLGNISEDILRDGNMQFENGLPHGGAANPILSSNWGDQPSNFPIAYLFDTQGEQRAQQDVGFDGLNNTGELSKFGVNFFNPVTGNSDPASDDFLFYLSPVFDNTPFASSVLDRYRYFRNPEGNSPAGSLEASTQEPDAEDINKDFNLDLAEDYNTYRIDLNNLAVGSNFVVDKKTVDVVFQNGNTSTVDWYLVRIPVRQYETGGSDAVLNNARFIRVVGRGFDKTTTIRFATFDLVRADWRRYTRKLYPDSTEGDQLGPGQSINNLEVGAVNIEENGLGAPPYVLPPGIIREELPTMGGVQSQNEASLFMRVRDLGIDARGVFKFMNLDMRRFKKLRLFVHAQNLDEGINPAIPEYDDQAKFFLRLGSDLTDNYYEYEISLKYTPQTATTVEAIWPPENTIDFNLQDFVKAKIERDNLNFPIINRYENYPTDDPLNKRITVKGRPSLGSVSTIMLGVRNYDRFNNRNIIVWVNEMRLSDVENDAGLAASSSLTFNLADFAQVNATGMLSTVGFGNIDQTPMERSQENMRQYSISTTINLDKFLPEKWGIKIPFSFSYAEQFIDPKYNPIDNDVKFEEAPRREELKEIVSTYNQQKTFAVTNLRKEKTNGSPLRFYNIENFSANFLYSDIYFRDIFTSYNLTQNLRSSIDYNYSFKTKYIEPFKKWRIVQDSVKISKYLQLIKNVNFNPIPTRITFRTEIQRTYNEFEIRDINSILNGVAGASFDPIYTQNFLFGWQYNLGWNLSRSLKIDIASATRTLADQIDYGVPDDRLIWRNLTAIGRPILYDQRFQLNYKLPLQFFPYLDFMNVEVGYNSLYSWQARSTALIRSSLGNIGNMAQNSNNINGVANLDFTKFYQKFKAFRKLDSIQMGRKRQLDSLAKKYEADYKAGRRNSPTNFRSKYRYRFYHYPMMFLSSIKRGQLNYSETNGTLLPGFLPVPGFFGIGDYPGANPGPTLGFLFGSQSDIRIRAFQENWITNSDLLNEPFTRTRNTQLQGNIQMQPARNFLIDLNFNRNTQSTLIQNAFNINPNAFENETRAFNMSTIALSTSFTNSSAIYNQLVQNSFIISSRLGTTFQDLDGDGYNDGYGLTNTAVLIPSFLSALNGQDASTVSLGYERSIPLPNWKITFSGLTNIPWFSKRLSKLEILHGYTSSYAVTGIQSNLNYFNAINSSNPADQLDSNGNFYNRFVYGTVGVMESFNPLIGFDLTTRNNIQMRFMFNRDRISMLSLSNFTLQEERGSEYILGFGYVIKDVKMRLRFGENTRDIKSDLNIRADVSLRDNETRVLRIVEADNQITGGQYLLSLRLSADYNFSRNLNIKFFYDQMMTRYKISTAFPLSTIRAGFSATFRFGN